MNIWLLVALHHMIAAFSMFWYERDRDHFTMGENKYNEMENVLNILNRVDHRHGEW